MLSSNDRLSSLTVGDRSLLLSGYVDAQPVNLYYRHGTSIVMTTNVVRDSKANVSTIHHQEGTQILQKFIYGYEGGTVKDVLRE